MAKKLKVSKPDWFQNADPQSWVNPQWAARLLGYKDARSLLAATRAGYAPPPDIQKKPKSGRKIKVYWLKSTIDNHISKKLTGDAMQKRQDAAAPVETVRPAEDAVVYRQPRPFRSPAEAVQWAITNYPDAQLMVEGSMYCLMQIADELKMARGVNVVTMEQYMYLRPDGKHIRLLQKQTTKGAIIYADGNLVINTENTLFVDEPAEKQKETAEKPQETTKSLSVISGDSPAPLDHNHVIHELESALEEAKAGGINEAIIILRKRDSTVTYASGCNDIHRSAGMLLDAAMHRLQQGQRHE